MMRPRALLALCVMLVLIGSRASGFQPPPGDQFVPVSQVPAADQLPAAPLLIAAYAFVWAALFVYLLSIWRRIAKVEADMRTLDRRSGARGGGR
jgi:CcmD family protein